VNVVVTIVLFAAAAVWAFAVYNRLVRLRERVKDAWQRLELQQDDAALSEVYNGRVKSYNEALQAFPANIIAALASFQPARVWRGSTGAHP
jgi:hypothetical protein